MPSRIVDLAKIRLRIKGVYTHVAVAYGCECHGYDSRFWTTLCNN